MLINGASPRKLPAPMPDLVLLPGFMCDAELWTDMLPDLAPIGPVHYGNVYQDDTLEGMARRVLAEAPGKFVLIGFSMGGFVARVLALMAADRVTGVAFVASSARGYSAEERARRQAGWQPGNRPPRANGVAAGLHPDRERDPVLLERLRSMQRRLGPAVRARQAALVRNDGYADLGRITCPALVVACRQDRLRTFAETEHMARCLPHARFEVIEDCGHMAPLERPRELAALLNDWLGRDVLPALTMA
ncbi:alpha/beta hydrolase [Reyranella sp.]|uniref:alpha/beta fold hydrolase n=1 Tax=Reyranella sp. TaxID=1929291 RepID=UPI002F937174